MRGFNKVIIAGNMVHDPEIKETGGKPRLSVAIAVNYTSGSGTEKKEGVYYFDVTMFGPLAENVAKYKKKGDPLLIEGILVQQRWETDGGQKRSKVGIIARDVQFLNRGGQGQGLAEDEPPPVGDEEIPF
jgi:single-strand DNA-binding protein